MTGAENFVSFSEITKMHGVGKKRLLRGAQKLGIAPIRRISPSGGYVLGLNEADVVRVVNAAPEGGKNPGWSATARQSLTKRWTAPPQGKPCAACGRTLDPLSGRCGC